MIIAANTSRALTICQNISKPFKCVSYLRSHNIPQQRCDLGTFLSLKGSSQSACVSCFKRNHKTLRWARNFNASTNILCILDNLLGMCPLYNLGLFCSQSIHLVIWAFEGGRVSYTFLKMVLFFTYIIRRTGKRKLVQLYGDAKPSHCMLVSLRPLAIAQTPWVSGKGPELLLTQKWWGLDIKK